MSEKNRTKTGKRRAPRTAFRKGRSGNPKGRPAGVPNRVTREARAACAEIVDDPIYRAKLLARARAGKLKPAIETMLWYYAKGKPVERFEVRDVDPVAEYLSDMSDERFARLDTLTRAQLIGTKLSHAEEQELHELNHEAFQGPGQVVLRGQGGASVTLPNNGRAASQ